MSKIIRDNFALGGMSCASCAARVEKVLNGAPGVRKASVNFANANANVEYDADQCTPERLQELVRDAGYELILGEGADELDREQAERYTRLKRRTVWAVALSLPVVIIGMFFMDMPYANLLMFLFSTPVVFIFGRQFFVGAWKQLRHRSANMDTLVALSTGIAWLFSMANMLFPEWWLARGIHPHVYFEAAAVIVAFILLGRTLESKAKGNTSTAIRRLMGLQPKTVTLVRADGTVSEIPIENVCIGDVVAVKPGERVAVDGTVVGGHSYVDESMLSGEALPVEKNEGDKVFAGTINGTGAFHFRADKIGADTLLSKIIRMVQDAQGSKAPVQQLVDKIAAVFVPVIIGIAVLAFAVWLILDNADGFSHGLLAAVTVLIIACPCALGLATPTAIMVGIGKGADNGILIKDAESLEVAPKINAIVLDKTGTVTKGKPQVDTVHFFREEGRAQAVLKALEQNSEHPLGHAITEYLDDVAPAKIDDFESITGMGVRARCEGRLYYAGNRRMAEANGVVWNDSLDELAGKFTARANSLVWFGDSEGLIALVGISDPVKATSAEAVAELESMGIEVYMLTGDNRATANAVASLAGIKHVEAEVLPHEKAQYVEKLQAQGKKVAMVGDGINDSAALAVADLSIAMGTGSDIAIDVAKMTIISADLAKIPVAVRLSKATVRTIRQNLFWAFIYNVIGVPVAAGILYPINGFLLNPMIAGAAMAFSSVSVVTNSLLLKRKKIGQELNSCPVAPVKVEEDKQQNTSTMTQKFKVEGMACGHCTARVEAAIKALAGVENVNVDLASGVATVEGNVDAKEISSAITAAGYENKLI